MNPQNVLSPRASECIPGVFLCRTEVVYDHLQVADFASLGLNLPKNLESAIHKRKIEFLLGRLCLKKCFEAFREAPLMIEMGDDRSPIWPKEWVGSISHSKGQIVAVLGRSQTHAGLGIDLEALIVDPSSALQTQICVDNDELKNLKAQLNLSEREALTLIFSCKESLYKLIFPRYRKFFGFQAARVHASDVDSLTIELVENLNEIFHQGRKWSIAWHRIGDATLETFIAELSKNIQN